MRSVVLSSPRPSSRSGASWILSAPSRHRRRGQQARSKRPCDRRIERSVSRCWTEAAAKVPLAEVDQAGIEAGAGSPDGVDRQPVGGEASVLKVSAVRPGWFDRR